MAQGNEGREDQGAEAADAPGGIEPTVVPAIRSRTRQYSRLVGSIKATFWKAQARMPFGNLYEIFKIARYAIRKIKERT